MRVSTFIASAALAAVTGFALATPVAAESTPATTQTVSASNNSDNEIVCHKTGAQTGTLVGQRQVCMTRKEWAIQHSETAHNISNYQRQQYTVAPH